MATKAYLVISVDEEFYQNRFQDVLRDLESVPEVESIERVSGTRDLLVKVDIPMEIGLVADKILPKEWVKRLRVLVIKPFRPDEYQGLTIDELLSLRRVVAIESTR